MQNKIRRLLFSCVFEVDMVFRNLIKHVENLSAHLETFLLFIFLLRTFHYMRYNVINVTTLYVLKGKYRAIEILKAVRTEEKIRMFLLEYKNIS